jgi:hypothetical protein
VDELFAGLFLAWCWGGLLWVGRKLGVLVAFTLIRFFP